MSRETKLQQRHTNKNFSKPFKKKIEKDQKRKERQKIRTAKQARHYSKDEEDGSSYEGK